MKKVWDTGELQAIEFLKQNWVNIITSNFKFWKVGEIDLVWEKAGKIIFYEVKKRFWNSHWLAVESLSFSKKMKIRKTIEFYCYKYGISLENVQFDFIAIQNNSLQHFENVELY